MLDRNGVRRSKMGATPDLVNYLRGGYHYLLDEFAGAADFADDGTNTSNDLRPRTAVHGSNMTEQTFKIVAEQSPCPLPNLYHSLGFARWHAAKQLGFQN